MPTIKKTLLLKLASSKKTHPVYISKEMPMLEKYWQMNGEACPDSMDAILEKGKQPSFQTIKMKMPKLSNSKTLYTKPIQTNIA